MELPTFYPSSAGSWYQVNLATNVNTGVGGQHNPGDNAGSGVNPGYGTPDIILDLDRIRAKVQWRWYNCYRSKGIHSTVPVNGFNFDI